MKLEDKLRSDIAGKHLVKLPSILQGISKELISTVLQALDRKKRDCVDAVWALLDNINPNWFYEAAKKGLKFSDGASTGHIAIHVGVYQRGGTKLDREGRDYWLKPLWEIGALEKVYFDPENATFLPGHPVAKSPNSAYRIAPSFLEILRSPPSQQPGLLRTWVTDEAVRARLQIQERLAEKTREEVGSPHQDLINAACEAYAPTFLPGFEVIYIDSTDGQRVTPKQEASLKAAGVAFSLGDSIPDVLLWNRTTDELWVIEAVTSDGEV
ncbi:MAG TPA: BsuBI/PstI family type II restriction endonuclease, partial [Verrucomicrobiae bacterium]|nr:BsuBI/PstI family type II restriction endonuclease [Verrucomicrobiae bacterium]